VSVPTTTLECESCGYTGSTGVVFGAFMYLVDDREYVINRTLGWCSDCDGFVPIEQFSDETVALARLESSIGEMSRYFSRTIMLCLTRRARSRRDSLLDDLSETAFRLRLGRDRRGTEKCLRCGRQQVVPVNCSLFPEDYYEESDTQTTIGFTHPDCGGQILASICPIRFNRVFEPEYFSINGYRLAGELNE
jgi:hypothetical protein